MLENVALGFRQRTIRGEHVLEGFLMDEAQNDEKRLKTDVEGRWEIENRAAEFIVPGWLSYVLC